jgi:uncharacterized membrane protein
MIIGTRTTWTQHAIANGTVHIHISKMNPKFSKVAQFIACEYIAVLGQLIPIGVGVASIIVSVSNPTEVPCQSKDNQQLAANTANLNMWLLVFGITLIVMGLLTMFDNRPSNQQQKMLAIAAGQQPKQNPILGLIGCFYCVWFIIGNVWFFWFTPETVFATRAGGNSTALDSQAINCATLENFGFILLICMWTVPFAIACCVQVVLVPMIMNQQSASFEQNPMGAPEESRTISA